MRYLIIVVLALAMLGSAIAKEEERPRCENCGMFEDVSPTRALATFKYEGKSSEHHFESLGCILAYNTAEYDGNAEVADIKVLDYASFGTEAPKLIAAAKAFFLYDTAPLKGSMEPFIAAFATRDAGKAAQATLEGELLQFPAMLAKLSEADDEEQSFGSGAALAYVCPCSGDCCTDVTSAKPGTCPKCGMELVPADQ